MIQLNDKYISRFFRDDDLKETNIFYSLPANWWSRHFEYIWAAQFVRQSDTVLDAACGVGHPFKFYLIDKCKEVFACDNDSRIMNTKEIIRDIEEFAGKDVSDAIDRNIFNNINLNQSDMSSLPYSDKQFDKLFCISVLEHVTEDIRLKSLQEFHRVLKDDGLIVLTVDYPDVQVEWLLEAIKQVGLKLYGESDYSIPENAISGEMIFERELKCIRLLLCKD